jgi:glucose/arabinose dehydrogenase
VQFDDTVEGEMGLLSMEFHPGFATNGIFFVDYVASNPRQDRVSRFVADPVALTVNTNTQQILFSVVDEAFNHNGGDLHFGPDGYLYIGMGDEGDQYNFRQNSQRIDKDFYSGLLRIDVDKGPEASNQRATPPSRPTGSARRSIRFRRTIRGWARRNFLGSPIPTNALRAEFFAVGFRHIGVSRSTRRR